MRFRLTPTNLGGTAIAAGTLALALAACGGAGSSGGFAPHAGPVQPPTQPSRHKAHAQLILRIPRGSHRKGRLHHAYVSPNTKALTVLVQQVTASPWPSPLPVQVLVVATPSPCSTSEGATTCSFAVQAYVGQDTFTFATYAVPSPGPSSSPLSTFSSGVITVAPNPTPLHFVLNGVVNKVVVTVPSPEATAPSIKDNTQPIPLATATSLPLAINPYDASGASILTDQFTQPITVSIGTAGYGLLLALASPTCAGDTPQTGSTSITITCAADLTKVTAQYAGNVTRVSGSIVDTATVVASPEPATTPPPATIVLSSVMRQFSVSGSPNGSFTGLTASTSGKLYFAFSGTSSVFGSIDPTQTNPASTVTTATLPFSPNALAIDGSGNIWISNSSGNAVTCFNAATASPVAVTSTTVASVAATPQELGIDSTGNLWFVASGSPDSGAGSISAGAGCTSAPSTVDAGVTFANSYTPVFIAPAPVQTPPPPPPPDRVAANAHRVAANAHRSPTTRRPMYLSPARLPRFRPQLPAGNLPAVWLGANGTTGAILNPNSVAGYVTPLYNFPTTIVGVGASDVANNLYLTSGPNASPNTSVTLSSYASGDAAPVPVATFPPNDLLDSLTVASNSSGLADEFLGADYNYAGLEYLNLSSGQPIILPAMPEDTSTPDCQAAVFDSFGDPWVACADTTLTLNEALPTSAWSLVPYGTATKPVTMRVTCQPDQIVGILETGDSSPFTAVSSNTAIATIDTSSPWPTFAHIIPIQLNMTTTGTATISVTDKYGYTQSTVIDNLGGGC